MFQDLFENVQRGTMIFMGLLCSTVFLLNVGLLFWLGIRRGSQGFAKCPQCGRMIACMHCEDDEHGRRRDD